MSRTSGAKFRTDGVHGGSLHVMFRTCQMGAPDGSGGNLGGFARSRDPLSWILGRWGHLDGENETQTVIKMMK